ncbi:MAG: type II toxin-antitoxin system RelE/ParE family toxin [Bacteroidales bacterium]|nr:type II toxin-antitoxin system RelE/ParE family toxin [Bacteroidales bacterium]
MKEKIKVEFLQGALDFLDKLDEKTRDKILFNIDRVKVTEDKNLFKKLSSDIWEFRTLFNKKLYRLFAFWDKTGKTNTIIIATHGIIKTTTKIPKREINKAVELMRKYFQDKKHD